MVYGESSSPVLPPSSVSLPSPAVGPSATLPAVPETVVPPPSTSPVLDAVPDLEAQGVLERMVGAMGRVESGRMDFLVRVREIGVDGAPEHVFHSAGSFREPGLHRGVVETFQDGLLESSREVLGVGWGRYVFDAEAVRWDLLEGDVPSGQTFSGLSSLDFGARDVSSPELVGVEVLEGEEVHHIRGRAPGHILARLSAQGRGAFVAGPVEYWVGVSDDLLRLMRWDTKVRRQGSRFDMEGVLSLSGYGEPFDLDVPGMDLGSLDLSELVRECHPDDAGGSHCH